MTYYLYYPTEFNNNKYYANSHSDIQVNKLYYKFYKHYIFFFAFFYFFVELLINSNSYKNIYGIYKLKKPCEKDIDIIFKITFKGL